MAWVCLMYHDVTPEPVAPTGGPLRFAVPRAAFARQLDCLVELGLPGQSIAERLSNPSAPGVAISFDDGDLGQFDSAFPELCQRHMTATFFVVTSWVGQPGYVEWSQLRTMREAGMSIQSHSHTHPFFSTLSPTEVADELGRSKALLDEHLGQDTDTVSLPNGDFPRAGNLAWLHEAGYRLVAGSRWGTNPTNPGDRALRRCTVQGQPSEARFRRIALGSPALSWSRQAREASLNSVRRLLGPDRYARWRRRILDALPH